MTASPSRHRLWRPRRDLQALASHLKGFGFITRDDGGEDLFSSLKFDSYRSLNDGDAIEFSIGSGNDRWPH
uniref:CSD domain-containing protein n=1 Tax=Oryza punctata TaxID=4537 RepID=A0A0E0KI72_ORYPU